MDENSLSQSGLYDEEESRTYDALMLALREESAKGAAADPQVINILGKQLTQVSAKLDPDQWVVDLIRTGELRRMKEILDGNVPPLDNN